MAPALGNHVAWALSWLTLAAGCARSSASVESAYDPLAAADESLGRVGNREAGVPPMCYTKTAGASNPCWVCHTSPVGSNPWSDWELQLEYAFSDAALDNHWTNLQRDRRAAVAAISDAEILAYVRQDNYAPLRRALAQRTDYPGYVPDLDLSRGFDDAGFARDGSGWRAVRYHPLAGSFWPSNGSADDVFIRLPDEFRRAADGAPSREVYRANLAILEAAIAGDPRNPDGAIDRDVEPIDERVAGADLDGDGARAAGVTRIRALPAHYAGAASRRHVRRWLYPQGTEFLHSVRYLDPDAASMTARRMKELRYARKAEELDAWGIVRAFEKEHDDKDEGTLPVYRGAPRVGLLNALGWQLQGFIEDERGRLRLQTEEEHRFCMGCHSALGVTVDQTFAFARKVPGAGGWRVQDLRGLIDRPQDGHADPEVLTYFVRVGGGDELRANAELIARWFRDGAVDGEAVRRVGAQDLFALLAPSRERALLLDKAYRVIVMEQSFARGRDPVVSPIENVHARIENGSTDLAATGRIFRDGHLHLDWR